MIRTLILAALLPVLLFAGLGAAPSENRKLVLIAGKQSHGPGDHEFRAGSLLLKKCLEKTAGLEVVVVPNGWPEDDKVFDGATAVVIYADGGGGHTFIQDAHLKAMTELANNSVGIGAM